MAHPRNDGQEGLANGQAQSMWPASPQPAFKRPFTLNEALPYTPFTAVVTFDSDVIPIPSLGAASPAPPVLDVVPTHDFDTLNREARNEYAGSQHLEQGLASIQHLLNPERITQFEFKAPAKAAAGKASGINVSKNLAPFSKMVFDQTAVSFRYIPPETPGGTSPTAPASMKTGSAQLSPSARKSPKVRRADHPKHSVHAKINENAHGHNAARFEIALPVKTEQDEAGPTPATAPIVPTAMPTPPIPATTTGEVFVRMQDIQPQMTILPPATQIDFSTPLKPVEEVKPQVQTPMAATPTKPSPHTPVASSKPATIAIELPPSSVNREEYLVVPDSPDEPVNLSARKRKREEYHDSQDALGEGLDLRQRADGAFHELFRCAQAVFEAETDLAQSQAKANALMMRTNENEVTMTSSTHHKVQTLLQKTISLGCYGLVPLDDLLHLMRLTEGALSQAEGMDVKFDDSWGETACDAWLQQFPEIDNGLRAARTALRMMCGGRQDKPLYSEDVIQKALNLFKNVMDGIIIPLAELRNSGSTVDIFKQLSRNKDLITAVFMSCHKLFSLFTDLVSSIDTSETVITTLEFASSRLIFIETAHAERDSVVEIQKFDGMRLIAMDMLSHIFLLNPDQRQGIFDDILTSLEKLPVGKQRARQFKLVDSKSIQPVSALIMRLVQASAGIVDDAKLAGQSGAVQSAEREDEEGAEEDAEDKPLAQRKRAEDQYTTDSEERAAIQHATAITELQDVSTPLLETAKRNASYVINFIVNRALKSTKSGDTPYRNLLDLFVEDFTTCLDSPDWPAAELLLRLLVIMMVKLVEGERTAAPAKNMALELLGVTGAAISKLRSHVRKTAAALDTLEHDELGVYLSDLAASALELKSRPEHMCSWSGPYRATLEYLNDRCSDDPHLSSAISYIIAEWAGKIWLAYEGSDGDQEGKDAEFGRLAYRLRMMIQDRRWLSNEYTFKAVSPGHARLSYCITLLRSQLCESFSAILNMLLKSMASDQATVRSKSLKSINQVMETDPSILDGESIVVQLILQCSNDSSTQVRDSAVGLIGKSLGMRPALEEMMTPTVIQRFTDTGPGVRKRAMKLARDIYLRNQNRTVRSSIANGLLHRVQDPEESVRDLARQLIEEIWFTPFYGTESTAVSQTSLAEHVALIIQAVKQGNVSSVLDKVLQSVLAADSKTAQATFDVCTKFVASMFDLVDNPDSDDASIPTGRDTLQVLMIFAKADPKLFTFEQIRLLKPHITTVATSEDMSISRAVVVIYRRVLPQLSSVHNQFLSDVRKELMPAVSKVTRAVLDDVVACLWIISTLLETSEHLARLVLSSLSAIQKFRKLSQLGPLDEHKIRQFGRYSLIVGMAGKHCDLDAHHELFKTAFPTWNGTSISKLMVDLLVPFAAPSQALEVRKAALDAVGLVCQSSPRNYVSPNVYTAFQQVFNERLPALETMILRSLKEFLFIEEKRSEEASQANAAEGAEAEKKRELTVMGGTNYDDVASATTQRFLQEITRVALSTLDDHAFLAVEILASINRQGLVHPKETGVTFITLETSPLAKISELAFIEHKALHEKHETVLEREYIKAVQAAFNYQKKVARDVRGATASPYTPKLHLLMEVLKISRSKNRQRFLSKLCDLMDFEPAKLDVSGSSPAHVELSRFILENMAFFEYLTIGEVQGAVAAMEKLVSSTGSALAHAIDSEIFQLRMDAQPTADAMMTAHGDAPVFQPTVDMNRLRQLTAGSMILAAVWEARTYLRRLYGMRAARQESKAKTPTKDLSKAPVKVQGITGDKFWEDVEHIMSALASPETMMAQCKAFVELLNVDKEFKVPDEDEELNGEGPATPSNDEDDDVNGGLSERGRKRKASSTPGSGRKKRARSSSQVRKRGRPRKPSVDPDADGEFEDVDWM